MEVTFEGLRKIQLLEKTNANLISLESDFYSSHIRFLSENYFKLKKNFSFEEARVCENMLKVLKNIMERREQKIVLKVLRDAREASEGEDRDATIGLTREEKELYFNLLRLIKGHASLVDAVTSGAPAGEGATSTHTAGDQATIEEREATAGAVSTVLEIRGAGPQAETQGTPQSALQGIQSAPAACEAPEALGAQGELGFMKVRMLVDLPSFLGHDKTLIGPLKAMQVVQLHESDAAILLKHGAAEEIKAR